VPEVKVAIGQMVRSIAGRDSGWAYVVIDIKSPTLLLLADGRSRKTAEPKKKNVRHICVLPFIDPGVAAKLASGEKVTDEDVRRAVRACAYTGEKKDADEEGELCRNKT
jgi:ribosomal protein L14E/L6E/L27E